MTDRSGPARELRNEGRPFQRLLVAKTSGSANCKSGRVKYWRSLAMGGALVPWKLALKGGYPFLVCARATERGPVALDGVSLLTPTRQSVVGRPCHHLPCKELLAGVPVRNMAFQYLLK
jgi:hypothetical protein